MKSFGPRDTQRRRELIELRHEMGKSPFSAVGMNEDDGCPPTPDIAHNTGAGSWLDCLVCSNLNFFSWRHLVLKRTKIHFSCFRPPGKNLIEIDEAHVRSGWAGHPLSGIVTAGLDQKERRKQPISNFVVAGSGCHWKRNRRERAKGKPELLERFAAGLECGLRILLHVSRVAGSQRWMGRFGTNGSRIRLAGILTEFSTAPVALYDRRGSRHDRCIRPISFLLIRAHLSKWKTQVWSHAAVHIPPKSHQPCPCGIFVPAAQIHNFWT